MTHTLSFTAALAIHTFSWKHAHPLSTFCITIFHGKLDLNTCSVELPGGGVLAMNNLILAKWRICTKQ